MCNTQIIRKQITQFLINTIRIYNRNIPFMIDKPRPISCLLKPFLIYNRIIYINKYCRFIFFICIYYIKKNYRRGNSTENFGRANICSLDYQLNFCSKY